MPRFGHVIIRNDGITEKFLDYETIDCFVIITAPLKIKLPNFLHDIFQKHYASEMFEAELDYIGLVAVMHFDCVDLYSIISYLSDAAKQVRLDAFTETMLRPNAEALIAELMPYMAWFDYAAVIAEQVYNDKRHEQLVADMNLLLSYLSQGGELDFAKMTSLCDVTGSLQPVRNLILSKMPELTA